MQWLFNLLLVVQVICAIGVIVLVLLQHGKGADMGAAFGSGASGSLFGATGSANFLSRTTGALAAGFFICTLGLAFLGGHRPSAPKSVMDGAAPAAPAIPAQAPAGDASTAKGDAAAQKNQAPSDIPK